MADQGRRPRVVDAEDRGTGEGGHELLEGGPQAILVPQCSRWSGSTLVTSPASTSRARKVPSLSSASITSGPAVRPRSRCGPDRPRPPRPRSRGRAHGLEGWWRRARWWWSSRGCPTPQGCGGPGSARPARPTDGRPARRPRGRRPPAGGRRGRGRHDHEVDLPTALSGRSRAIPAARSGSRNGESGDGSWPLTSWPISARTMAMALMPAPPAFITWILRATSRPGGVSHERRPPPARRCPAAAAGRAHRCAPPAISSRRGPSARRSSTSRARRSPSSSESRHEHRGPGAHQVPGVARLLVGGDVRRRDQQRRQGGGGQLEARAGAAPTHREVGGGQRRRHVVLVGHHPVGERRHRPPAARPRAAPSHGVRPRGARPGRDDRATARGRHRGLVEPEGAQGATEHQHQATLGVDPEGGLGGVPVPDGVEGGDVGPDRVARHHGAGQGRTGEAHRGRLGEAGQDAVGDAWHLVLLGHQQRHPQDRRGEADGHARVAADRHHHGGRSRRTRPSACQKAAASSPTARTLATVSRRWIPRPGSSVVG